MTDIMNVIIQIAVVLFSLSLHESAHAWVADRFGDPTARMMGRITLNPVPHIDPIGTVVLPAILAFTGAPVFGWAKPVMVNPYNLRYPLRDEMYIAAAGPVSNLIAAAISVILFLLLKAVNIISPMEIMRLLYMGSGNMPGPNPLTLMLFFMVLINVFLAIFNLIPVPPLDGSKVLRGFLRGDQLRVFHQFEQYGFILLLVIMFSGALKFIAGPVFKIIFKILF